MKVCAIENDVRASNHSAHVIGCVDVSGNMNPEQNDDMDAVAASLVALYTAVSVFCLGHYIRMRRCSRPASSGNSPPASSPAIQSSVSALAWAFGVVHIFSVFVTYGFFADTLGPALLTKHCSVWTVWMQYVAGFSSWAAVLSAHLIGVAIIIVRCVRVTSARRRRAIYLLTAALVIAPMVAVGIVVEAVPNMFEVVHHGLECRTSVEIKFSIMAWLVALAVVFGVCARIVKHATVRAEFHRWQSDSLTHLVDAEIGIAKYALPTLAGCIFLNFTHLVNYAAGRFAFLALVLLMHSKSSWVLFAGHVLGNSGFFRCTWFRRRAEYHHMDGEDDYERGLDSDDELAAYIEMADMSGRDVIDESSGDASVDAVVTVVTENGSRLLDIASKRERVQAGGAEFDAFLDYLQSTMIASGRVHSIECSFNVPAGEGELVDTAILPLEEWCALYRDLVALAITHDDDDDDLSRRLEEILDAHVTGQSASLSALLKARCVGRLVDSLDESLDEDEIKMVESVVSFMRALMVDGFFDQWYYSTRDEEEERDDDVLLALADDGFIQDSGIRGGSAEDGDSD